jgi:hypothetical protein
MSVELKRCVEILALDVMQISSYHGTTPEHTLDLVSKLIKSGYIYDETAK